MNKPVLLSDSTCHIRLATGWCHLPHVKLKVFGRMLDMLEVPVKITEGHWTAYMISATGEIRKMVDRRITHRSSFGGVGRGRGEWALLCCHAGGCSHASHLERLRKILGYLDRKASCTIESNFGFHPKSEESSLIAAPSTGNRERKAASSVVRAYQAV